MLLHILIKDKNDLSLIYRGAKKLKKKIIAAALLLCFTQLITDVYAVKTESYSWYFKPRNDHQQPGVFDNNGFLNQHQTIYLGNPDDKKIYLTFDVGYENGNVEKIVNILDKYQVKGTFFTLPHFVKENVDLVKRMAAEGHTFGNHTNSHRDMSKITDFSVFQKELTDLEDVFHESTGGLELSKYYRPPQGSFSEQNLEFADKMGYNTVFWSLAYADWDNNKQMNPTKALELVLSRIHNGCVLLLHPTSSTNVLIMENLILRLKEQGYEFGTLEELKKTKQVQSKETVDLQQVVVANRDAKKRIAFTFDDGPDENNTPQILDILKQYNAKGTFFVVGKNAERNPAILQREFKEGHEIGNHTYSHPSLRKISVTNLMNEIEKTNNIVYNATGKRPKLFRPPGGFLTDSIIDSLTANDYTSVLWSWRQDTKDWNNPSVKSIVNLVMKNLQDGDIILFHDYHKGGSPTPDALKILLPKLKEMGYSFVTVSDLINYAS